MAKQDILLIDDDVDLCELLRNYLSNDGFCVETVHDGPGGLERAIQGSYSLVVLDVMLPGMNGLEVLRLLRQQSFVPVLMLTARGDDVDRIVGLEMGADDYLAKPFNPRELLARIRAVQRRATAALSSSAHESLHIGDLELNRGRRSARCGERELSLTGVEFSLLELLLRSAPEPVTRDVLSRGALERAYSPLDRSIDVHVSNLRKKLGPRTDGGERIIAVRGVGYAMVF
ncbi:MAG: response regulator transcription factor [Myxococcota bacterium]|jgi:two-component system response regulator CpxR|nr:response regulator transcription factor [Myxococcota bacterium]